MCFIFCASYGDDDYEGDDGDDDVINAMIFNYFSIFI